jgi:hypothetical protein
MRTSAAFSRALVAACLCIGPTPVCAGQQASKLAKSLPIIQTDDVDRFYSLYDAAKGHPSAEQLQHGYLDKGSDGLHNLAKARNVTGAAIAARLDADPQLYSNAKRCAAVLPRVRQRLIAAMRTLVALFPEAGVPPITIAVGRGKPVAMGSPTDGVIVGLEALCGVRYFDADVEDRFVHVISHEYVHVQQPQSITEDSRPTVLQASLMEGAAEFIGEKISGAVANPGIRAEARGHEAEIETRFVADEQKTDLSDWLFNGTLDQPGDLGYWVGYRIVASYYAHATDKRRAIREILRMTDPVAFLAKSGWRPGIAL